MKWGYRLGGESVGDFKKLDFDVQVEAMAVERLGAV
jgi:hypothetical protein